MLLVVTRAEDDAAPWEQALRSRGHEVLALPLLGIRAVADPAPVRAIWERLAQFDAVMFVSGNAVRHFAAVKPQAARCWAQTAPHTRAWATGPGTTSALLALGLEAQRVDAPDAQSGQFDSEHLWLRVQAGVQSGQRVLIVRGTDSSATTGGSGVSGVGRDWLAAQLRGRGVQVEFVAVYERACPVWTAEQQAAAHRAVAEGARWLLSSSEAVHHLRSLLPPASLPLVQAHVTHERIGQVAQDAGCRVVTRSRPALADVLASIESSAAGPPQGAKAPLGGSELHAVNERGGDMSAAGPPQGARAPLGAANYTK